MTSVHKAAPFILALALLGHATGASANEPNTKPQGVGGRVLGETASPLGAAGVYAYQLTDLSLRKVQTDTQGNFLFKDLPAGLYQVIAHKPGFAPVVVMLTRTAASAYQFLELQLAPASKDAKGKTREDFWAIRARIPADVLHDIEQDERQGIEAPQIRIASSTLPQNLQLDRFQTDFQAMAGVDQTSEVGSGPVSSGGLGLNGQFGQMQVGLRGHFRQFNPDGIGIGSSGAASSGGEASTLSLNLAGQESHLSVMSASNRMVTLDGGRENPIALDHYQVNWSQGVGANGRSDFAAHYTEENNFHRQGPIDPLQIPAASRMWQVEGAYTTALGEGNTLQAGLRYRERQYGLSAVNRREDLPGQASVDLFGHGGVRVRPAVLLEYGLYSTLSDGSLALTPKGGIVVQLNDAWQVEANASQRVYQDAPVQSFFPSLFEQADLCEQGTEACYQLHFVRKSGEDTRISLGAVHKTVGETLRVYFSDDFFDRLESLYLVPGDEIPEVKLGVSRRLTPQILTSLQSSVGFGGGGTFVAADRKPYENQVHYMVTSLDTQFQSTATGVFVALHHLSQELEPLAGADRSSPQMEFDRLRLELTQDLNILFDLAAQWAVQLNMEVSRGPVSDDELRRRLMGGIAVKF
ncbi:MAG TPA: TonB-dependent receptor [Thermoanaerobaculia bacterium]|nr:TonB-dependent receptor [Thermoanaerobaculia bacterium]